MKGKSIPICEKVALTLEEAAEYSNIGIHKLRQISDEKERHHQQVWVDINQIV